MLDSSSRFFILGCQRSGTNLIRLILDSHPNAWVFGEPTAHWLLDNNFLDNVDKAVERWCSKIHNEENKSEIMRQVEILKRKKIRYFGYTTPGWSELFLEYDCIKSKLEHIPKIVFMLRNPFDVISSIIKLKDFARTTITTMELWLTDKNRKFKDRYSYLLHRDDELWKVRWFSVYWNYKTQSYLEMFQNSHYNILGVKYEDLCYDPKNTIEKVCGFLELPWNDDLLRHEEKVHFETINNITNGGTPTNKGIFKSSLNKNQLNDREKGVIYEVNQQLMQDLDLIHNETSLRCQSQISAGLIGKFDTKRANNAN